MDIFLIIGLPGSGKTTLANQMRDRAPGKCIVLDDITDQSQLPESGECDELIITDVNFCDEAILCPACCVLRRKYPGVNINLIYFENDPDKCRRNIEYRNDGRNVEGTIRRFAPIYKVLEGHVARPIWQPRKENQ